MDDKAERGERSIRIDDTLDDHREAMRIVSGVENCLDSHPDRDGQWIANLRGELSSLVQTLRCHFSAEQDGPLYRSLPVTHPRFAERLRALESEHAKILHSAELAVAKVERLDDPQLYEIRELNAEVQLLVATIRRHEAEENEIILSAHWDEVGIGD